MSFKNFSSLKSIANRTVLFTVFWVLFCGISLAQPETPSAVISEHEQRLNAEGSLQRTKESWMDEKKELLSRLESLEKENKNLEREKTALARNRQHLEESLVETKRELEEGTRLEEEVDLKLEDLFSRIKTAVAEDLPFLTEEREKRLAILEDLMADPNSSSAEKLRRMLETLRIEADYGFTSEITRASIPVNGSEIVAEILRLGRIGLFYRTGDGHVGFFDMADSTWKPLEKSWEVGFARAFEMADHKRAPDLVLLPVGRIVQ